MVYVLISFLIASLGLMIYQDIKFRHIHAGLPMLVFAVVFYMNKELIDLRDIFKSGLFLAVNFFAIAGYFSIKNSTIINPFKSYIGIGDLIFLVGVIPMFSFRNYILFFITGMLFSLVMYVIFSKNYVQKTIPLAGYLSLYIILLMIPNAFLSINLFYDFVI